MTKQSNHFTNNMHAYLFDGFRCNDFQPEPPHIIMRLRHPQVKVLAWCFSDYSIVLGWYYIGRGHAVTHLGVKRDVLRQ
jgi:hypothetical protein